MSKIEEFVKQHEQDVLSSREEELLTEGMTGGVDIVVNEKDCDSGVNNCKGGNCIAGCSLLPGGGGLNQGGGKPIPANTYCQG